MRDIRKLVLNIDQDVIDTMAVVGREVFQDVLCMDWDACFLTDLSSLSDFLGRGDPPAEVQALIETGTQSQYCAAWDYWILNKIERLYGHRPKSTTEPLVQLLPAILAAREPQTLQ